MFLLWGKRIVNVFCTTLVHSLTIENIFIWMLLSANDYIMSVTSVDIVSVVMEINEWETQMIK